MTLSKIVVIGAGFAGTMTAAHLLDPRLATGPLRILLIERQPPAGPGVAFGTADPAQLLNVPAAEMSAWPDQPDHFAAWLRAEGLSAEAPAFAERGHYGRYLQDQLQAAIRQAPADRGLEIIRDEAIGLLPDQGRLEIRLASRAVVVADRVVLAPGHFPPARPAGLPEALTHAAWYVGEPWSPAALDPLPPGSEALLVGTGLTAVDLAVALLDHAGAARVHLVSRRAQLPLAWEPPGAWPAWLDPETAPTRTSRLLAMIRAEARRAETQGASWRAAFDRLRPHTGRLWQRLPLVERRRFLRHARPYWDAHRQAMPPATAARVVALRADGRLEVHAARLSGLEPTETGARAQLSPRQAPPFGLDVARVIVCTGPEANSRRLRNPLIQAVIGCGLGRPDPLYLGLDVTLAGALIDEDGSPGQQVWAIGTLRKGALWETAAVAELRDQARDVAAAVAATLQPPPACRVQGP